MILVLVLRANLNLHLGEIGSGMVKNMGVTVVTFLISALDLEISERTLYRKIKEYDINA